MARYANDILKIVCEAGKHLSAEQIFLKLKEQYPGVVIASVYNNLNGLLEKGLIRKICVEGFADRFDSSIRHDHMVCVQCGELKDINLPDMIDEFSSKAGVPLSAYDLKLFYTCDKCQAENIKADKKDQ